MNGIGDYVTSIKESRNLVAQVVAEFKGEAEGHPFRGNQWTNRGTVPYIMQDSPTAFLNEMTIKDAKLPETHLDGLERIEFLEGSFIPSQRSTQGAYGTYNPATKTINLSSNADNIAMIGGAVVLHEIGHHVHLAKMTDDAAKEWGSISRNGESCRISAYGRTNQGEHFSEAYRAYAQGGTHRSKLKNMEPESYKFMAKVFRGKGMLPVGEQSSSYWVNRYDTSIK